MNTDYQRLCKRLDYQFNDLQWLRAALSHRSTGRNNNERLEFLGDAILSAVIAEALFQQFPDADEGVLSRLRASLVKGETLAKLARQLELGDYLLLGSGEMKSGGFRRDSILAGTLEAIIGAVFLDGGQVCSHRLIHTIFREELAGISPDKVVKDPKTRLQEYLQSRKSALPVYNVQSIEGGGHEQRFTVDCYVEELGEHVTGQGASRRKAEQDAAARMLEKIQKRFTPDRS
ncbi:MAG TPA: ribonuclease III [Gammaproteobacteria bacterium]|nr:ribonuclease III [Gammaproteobacteria bacterium]